jgi:hypothetical protein
MVYKPLAVRVALIAGFRRALPVFRYMIAVVVAVVMWESPQGFSRGVGRVESRLLRFPCFPYPGISMASLAARVSFVIRCCRELEILKNDTRFIFKAAAHAQRAADYLQAFSGGDVVAAAIIAEADAEARSSFTRQSRTCQRLNRPAAQERCGDASEAKSTADQLQLRPSTSA